MGVEQQYCRRCGRTTPHMVKPALKMVIVTCTVCRASSHVYMMKK